MNKAKKIILYIVIAVLSIALLVGVLCATIQINSARTKESYYDTLTNLPVINNIEEELEPILVSTNIEVYNTELNGDEIVYSVFVDYKYKYIVLYEITKKDGAFHPYYKWEYVSHRYIGVREQPKD